MARVKKHSLLEAISGAIGKEIVIKQYKDKTVISKFPDMSSVKASKRQKAQRDLIVEANAYARRIKNDPLLRVKYEKKVRKGESVYHYAIREFFEQRKRS